MKKLLFKLVRLPLSWKARKRLAVLINIFHSSNRNVSVADINRSGFRRYDGYLDSSKIENICCELENLRLFDQWNINASDFMIDQVPNDCHVAHYYKHDLIKIKGFKEVIENEELKLIADSYLGGNSYLVDYSVWWTFGNKDKPQEAELFHRDIDNILWLKFFIYLTDVNTNNGPHVYIPGSHRSKKFLSFRRFSDEEAVSNFGKMEIFTGRKGDLIIEDTFGIHKGTNISGDNRRLLLQFQYAALPRLY